MELTEEITRHQVQAEWSFAACALLDAEYIRGQFGWVDPERMIDPDVKAFWGDVLTGKDPAKACIDRKIFGKLTGKMTEIPSSTYAGAFAEAISDDIYLRAIVEGAGKLATMAVDRDVPRIVDHIRELALSMPRAASAYPGAADAHLGFIAMLDGNDRTLKSGLPSVDLAIGGFERGTETVMAARPSMGKTSLLYQWAEYIAEQNLKAVYFSLEMRKERLWAKRVCGLLGIDYRLVKARNLTDYQKEQIIQASADLVAKYESRLTIIDTPTETIKTIWQAVAEIRPDLVIVDHLGIVDTANENRVRELGQVTRAGKVIAEQFDCHFVFAMQLNRGTEARENKRPVLSDLRESGEIEQNADTVVFLYRGDYYDDPKPNQIVSDTEYIIAKNRDGARNVRVNLEYHLKKQEFFCKARE